jgi:hypothetical protein
MGGDFSLVSLYFIVGENSDILWGINQLHLNGKSGSWHETR